MSQYSSDSLCDTISSVNSSISETLSMIGEIESSVFESLQNVLQNIDSISSSITDSVSELIHSDIVASFPEIMSCIKTYLEHFDSSDAFSENDFVVLDQKPTREFEIPDTIAIPVGHNRVRIKTDLFLSILISIFFGLVGCIQTGLNNQQFLNSKQSYQESLLQIEEERNQIIHDFLDSVDLSHSSQNDSIDSVIKSIEYLIDSPLSSESPHPDSGSSLDPDQENHSNSPE